VLSVQADPLPYNLNELGHDRERTAKSGPRPPDAPEYQIGLLKGVKSNRGRPMTTAGQDD
jgi:hypothetical protein